MSSLMDALVTGDDAVPSKANGNGKGRPSPWTPQVIAFATEKAQTSDNGWVMFPGMASKANSKKSREILHTAGFVFTTSPPKSGTARNLHLRLDEQAAAEALRKLTEEPEAASENTEEPTEAAPATEETPASKSGRRNR